MEKVEETQKEIRASIIQQVSVFMENRPGKLAEIMEVLRSAKINIKSLSIAEAGDFGIIRMIVGDADIAYTTLRESGYIVSVTEVLVVDVRDVSELYTVARKLGEAGINIEYAYSFSDTSSDKKTKLVLRVKDPKSVVEIISNHI